MECVEQKSRVRRPLWRKSRDGNCNLIRCCQLGDTRYKRMSEDAPFNARCCYQCFRQPLSFGSHSAQEALKHPYFKDMPSKSSNEIFLIKVTPQNFKKIQKTPLTRNGQKKERIYSLNSNFKNQLTNKRQKLHRQFYFHCLLGGNNSPLVTPLAKVSKKMH